MIDLLQRIAVFLHRWRPVVLVIGVGGGVLLVLSLVDNAWLDDDSWLMPGFLAVCWALALYSLNALFLHVPARLPAAAVNWRQRLHVFLCRSALGLLGLLFVVLSLALLVLTFQVLRLWYMT